MSNTEQDNEGQAKADQELALLKERADQMGIQYKSNIGLETLRERVKNALEGTVKKDENDTEDNDEDDEILDEDEDEEEAVAAPVKPKKVKPETEQEMRTRLRKESLYLIRCRIMNMNPAKADLGGEIITVGNKFIGTVSKMIPFGKATDNGYHIPKVIYDDLLSRQFQQVFLKKNKQGFDEVETRLVPEYNIQVLPALTMEELQELAARQQAAERLGA